MNGSRICREGWVPWLSTVVPTFRIHLWVEAHQLVACCQKSFRTRTKDFFESYHRGWNLYTFSEELRHLTWVNKLSCNGVWYVLRTLLLKLSRDIFKIKSFVKTFLSKFFAISNSACFLLRIHELLRIHPKHNLCLLDRKGLLQLKTKKAKLQD